MAQNAPGPNFDLVKTSISTAADAAKTATAELSKLGNTPGVQDIQAIIASINSLKTELKVKINSFKTKLNANINSLKTELNTNINSLKTELNAKIDSVKTELNTKIKIESEKTRREVTTKIDEVKADLRKETNERIRLQNTQSQSLSPTPSEAPLIPPKSIQTGRSIPNCPTTINQINNLSQAEAGRILEELGVWPPRNQDVRLKALREQYILHA